MENVSNPSTFTFKTASNTHLCLTASSQHLLLPGKTSAKESPVPAEDILCCELGATAQRTRTKWPRDLRTQGAVVARSGCPGKGHGAGDTNPSLTTFLHLWGSNL